MPDSRKADVPEGSLPRASLHAQRMSLLIRVTGFLLGMFATALAAIILSISISFDDRQINLGITDFLAGEYGRTFSTSEDIHLALWPWPRLQIGEASLSEPEKPDTFASWKKGSFELDALALLRHKLVIRHARIEGLTLRLTRNAKGVWNVADLFATTDQAMSAEQAFSLELEGLALMHGHVVMEDAGSGRKLQWHELELGADALRANRGGRVQLITQLISPEDALQGRLTIAGRYRFGDTLANGMLLAGQLRYAGDIGKLQSVDGMLTLGSASWQGQGWTFSDAVSQGIGKLNTKSLEWSAKLPAASLTAGANAGLQAKSASADLAVRDSDTQSSKAELHLSLQNLVSADKSASNGKLSGKWLIQDGQRSAEGKFEGQLQHKAELAEFRFEKIAGDLSLTHPVLKGGNARASLQGSARWSAGTTEEKPRTSGPSRGDLMLNAIFGKDALRLSASLAAGNANLPAITARIDSAHFDVDRLIAPLPAMKLPSAESLQGWSLDGVLHAQDLRIGGMLMTSAHVPVRIADGKLALNEHAIALYGGTLKGNISYDPSGSSLSLFEALREVQVDQLAHDTKISLPLVGLSNATLDVHSKGPDWQKNAGGVLRVFAKNARWVGVDLPSDMLRLHAGETPRDDKWSATPLSEISAAFTVDGPELIVSKLTAQSDKVSLTGSGNIQYAAGNMDFSLSARPGNDKALAVLRGQRMSLRAQGPVMQPRLKLESAREGSRVLTQSTTPAARP